MNVDVIGGIPVSHGTSVCSKNDDLGKLKHSRRRCSSDFGWNGCMGLAEHLSTSSLLQLSTPFFLSSSSPTPPRPCLSLVVFSLSVLCLLLTLLKKIIDRQVKIERKKNSSTGNRLQLKSDRLLPSFWIQLFVDSGAFVISTRESGNGDATAVVALPI